MVVVVVGMVWYGMVQYGMVWYNVITSIMMMTVEAMITTMTAMAPPIVMESMSMI